MSEQKFNIDPILNSPYAEPVRHWRLGADHMPAGDISPGRRPSSILMPIPRAVRHRRSQNQELDMAADEEQRENSRVNLLREEIAKWRKKPPEERGVSGVTARLLRYWHEGGASPRPFFCQLEAAETFIWLNEIAPRLKARSEKIRDLLQDIDDANAEASPDAGLALPRLAAKMATGAGKTTVMAMLIAYHAVNKARAPKQQKYSRRFLIVTPGITIKDRLRVLLPQDPNNYYEKNRIVPPDMLDDLRRSAEVVITNYHAFQRREKIAFSKRQREILRGNARAAPDTKETEGQMLARVCPELLRGGDRVIVINDEAHHCYIHKQDSAETAPVTEEEKEEAKRSNDAARLWINGVSALQKKAGVHTVYDLSATPFFLRGSGYPEGSLFPWVVSDFSLMDAIESGIVKLPRVPVTDATTTDDNLPLYRNLYEHIRKKLPKAGAGKQAHMNPQDLPSELMGALQALYSHYEKTHTAWAEQGATIPPAFIIVCNNTSTSKLVYDLISGYETQPGRWRSGLCPLFNNVNAAGDGLLPRPRTLLIDSYQLESGGALGDDFKKAAAAEIELFKEELRIRHPERAADDIADSALLREVMNTVGKKGCLGEQIRCVVSVSMLTEGWDTNNVTHILGVRAFSTQLLCEQVVGRALRRAGYEIQPEGSPSAGKFLPEYADVFGVPFKFAAGDKTADTTTSPAQSRVRHLDERDHLEITFPRARGYRIKPPENRITAVFGPDSILNITASDAPYQVAQRGIIGEGVTLTLDELKKRRVNEVVFFLASYIAEQYYKPQEGAVSPGRFRDLVPIVRHYLRRYVKCRDQTFIQYLLWRSVAVKAAERIYRACAPAERKSDRLLPLMDPFTPEGSTAYVDFLTRKKRLHETRPDKSHINLAVCDSDWEMQFCKTLEAAAEVLCYARNEGLGLEIPYTHDKQERVYRPDYIVLINDGRPDPLNLIVEVKGYRSGRAQAKADTMRRLWIPAVNNDGRWGRWAFEEIMDTQDLDLRLMKDQAPLAKILQKYIRQGAAA